MTKARDYPETIGLVTINSTSQAQDVVIPELESAADDFGFDFRWEARTQRPTMWVDVGDMEAQIRVRSTFKPQTIRGGEYGWWWGDEVRDALPLGLKTAFDRLRCTKVPQVEYRLTTTTNGFDYVYERHRKNAVLVESWEDKRSGKPCRVWRVFDDDGDRLLVQVPTDVNKHVPLDYARRISSNHDELMAQQERDAEFIVMGNRVYYSFNRDWHVAPVKYDPNGEVIVTLDFNTHPCVAVVVQEIAGKTCVIAEITIPGGAGTPAVISEFQRLFPGVVPTIYGDPAGRHGDTRGNASDYQLWQMAIPECRFRVMMADPGYANRSNAMNARLRSDGKNHMQIDPSCLGLIADLEQVVYLENTRSIDKRNKAITHLSDALGYYVVVKYPCERGLDRKRLAAADAMVAI